MTMKSNFRGLKLVLCAFIALLVGSCSDKKNSYVPLPNIQSQDDFFHNLKDEKGNLRISKESEYIILLPDIQIYTGIAAYNSNLESIIDWIIKLDENGFKVKAVLQVGDITQNNKVEQWNTTHRIFSKLDNKVDYFFCTGNHDYWENSTNINRRSSYISQYFNYINNNSFIASYERGNFENTYSSVTIQNQSFLLFSIEFGPRNRIINWVDSISKANSTQFKMLLTHAYLEKDKVRYDFSKYGLSQANAINGWKKDNPIFFNEELNDGEMIWRKLIFPNNNFKFVFCGHQTVATGKLVSNDYNNNRVLQMIYADHRTPSGINGWVQILEFYKDKKTVGIKTYSPLLNSWNTDSLNQYEFIYNQK